MKVSRSTLFAALGVLLAAALLAWAFAPRPLAVETATATRGPFETTIDEDGRTRLQDRYVVSAPLAGRLSRITLREGDAVAAGDPVATLTPLLAPMLDERTAGELAAQVAAAEARLQRAAARLEGARVGVEQARSELRRSEQLAGQGFIAPTKLETDRLGLQAAQKELDAAAADRRAAGFELEQARAAQGVASRRGGSAAVFVVRAPVAGRVLKLAQTSEAVLALGTPIAEIGDTTKLEVVAELLTADALQAAPGTRVVIERWGGPDALEGRVLRVEPQAFTKVSALGVEEQRVAVHVAITSPPERWAALGDGFRVGVRIVTRSLADVLRVPVSAVFPQPGGGDAGAMAVFVVDGGRARLVPVRVGARNAGEAWIEDGLAAGATVIVYPPPAVADGSRVAPRRP